MCNNQMKLMLCVINEVIRLNGMIDVVWYIRSKLGYDTSWKDNLVIKKWNLENVRNWKGQDAHFSN